MGRKDSMPFKEYESIEFRSFLRGYRGAWFRCQIKEIKEKKGEIGVVLIYYDFPDEKMVWTKVYQKYNGRRHITLRPPFPSFYRDRQLPESLSETCVVVNDSWKVGDEVDWWTESCFWSATIIEKLDHDKFRVELWAPPYGEGSCYEADGKDLRPTLSWSLQNGWEVAKPKDTVKFQPCARLIRPTGDPIHWSPSERANERSEEVLTKKMKAGVDSTDPTHSEIVSGDPTDKAESSRSPAEGANVDEINEVVPGKKIKTEVDPIHSAMIDLQILLSRVQLYKRILLSTRARYPDP